MHLFQAGLCHSSTRQPCTERIISPFNTKDLSLWKDTLDMALSTGSNKQAIIGRFCFVSDNGEKCVGKKEPHRSCKAMG
ncbi:protein of unknown function [Cyanobium sp. NIES-981]|nr:protein of unknown function [Cyanobium sp. NIES-981]